MIEASDLVLADDGNSGDPVASRRVAEALAKKGEALRRLGRFEESVTVWEDLVMRYGKEPLAALPLIAVQALLQKARDLDRLGRRRESLDAVAALLELSQGPDETPASQLVIARALGVKARALMSVGSADDAVSCDEEIVARFALAEEVELRQWVAWALQHESRVLIRSGRIDEALSVSERLVSRLAGESAESLPKVAEITNAHIRLLLQIGAQNPLAVAQFVLEILANASAEALRAAGSLLTRHQPPPTPRRPRARSLLSLGQSISDQVVPSALVQRRRRAAQALHASRALIDRIGTSDDPDLRRLATTAEFTAGTALIVLGHLRAGFRVIDEITNRDDTDAIQAFQRLAELFQQDTSVVNQLGTIGVLSLRAGMLGRGDPDITQMAYNDSIAGHQAVSPHTGITRLVANWLRPSVKRTSPVTQPADEDPRGNQRRS